MSDLQCPYCEEELEVCHDDGFGYDEDEAHEMECSECSKLFVFNTVISCDYYPQKADCLNGSKHQYVPIATAPKAFTTMRCIGCDKRREPTEQERMDLELPTKEHYMQSLKEETK